jgi:hypothetical protein
MKAIDDKRKEDEEKVPLEIREAIKRGDRPGARTGVKGVLADYKAFKLAKYQQAIKEEVHTDGLIVRTPPAHHSSLENAVLPTVIFIQPLPADIWSLVAQPTGVFTLPLAANRTRGSRSCGAWQKVPWTRITRRRGRRPSTLSSCVSS